MLGLASFYGLERLIKKHRSDLQEHEESHAGVFWLHIAAFAIYNGLIGYLLTLGANDKPYSLLLYCVAMGMDFLVNDFALQSDHRELFKRRGRWILAMMPLAGRGFGAATDVSELTVSALTAFIGGSIILNVLNEELPKERNSRFGAFLIGSVGYSLLLLGLQRIN